MRAGANFLPFCVVLGIFDGAAAGGAAAGASGGESGTGNDQGDTKMASPVSTRRGKSGEYSNVVFGKAESGDKTEGSKAEADSGAKETQPHAAGEGKEGKKSSEDLHKEFLNLVNGKYKDAYTAETQKIINRRFGEERASEQQLAAQKPIIDALMQHYGIKDGDMTKLRASFDGDKAMNGVLFEREAEAAGMSVEQFREYQKLQQENQALREQETSRRKSQAAERTVNEWMRQAQEMIGTADAPGDYPSFDFAAECNANPRFIAMLRAGVPVRQAYEVAHLPEILDGTAKTASAEAEKRVTDSIRAKGSRPAENGTGSQTAIVRKSDPSQFTKADREEIARRVAKGERIVL